MKNLILTISCGDIYKEISALTHPTLKTYANKIGADFICISEQKISKTTPHWEKFQIFDLLNQYDRILFIDSDVIIREDCPNLFDIVPKDKLGAFNEGSFTDRSKELIIDCCKVYNQKLIGWDGKYYNSGIMVISRTHKYLFKKPEVEYCSFYEQTYLNMIIAKEVNSGSLKIHELDYTFNRMNCTDKFTGEPRHASFIIHYAGGNPTIVIELIKKDLEIWKNNSGKHEYKKNIYVSVTGGLGDQINAEPSIRFMKENVYPNDNIIIGTHHPRLFKHLNIPTYLQGEFQGENDTPYYKAETLPPPESMTWAVVSNLLCHTVDYCSMATMHRTLPTLSKQIRLEVSDDEIEDLKKIISNPEEYILVHPGKHWQSKTLPIEYWQKIIDGLAQISKIAIIGKDEDTRGILDIKCPENAIDLRNLLDLGSLIALISKAKMVISNDSAPIHIAGAFDNWIILIPTCKHPDHVLPYRNGGNVYYKAKALYKKLPCDEFNSQPTCIHGSSAEFIISKWEDYLLEPEKIISEIKSVL